MPKRANMKDKFGRDDILQEDPETLLHNTDFLSWRDVLLGKAACEDYDVPFVRALLRAGANPNHAESWGDTLLHRLAQDYMSRRSTIGFAILATAEALIEGGANLNAIGCNNLMPINICRMDGASEFEALLLRHGASPEGSDFA